MNNRKYIMIQFCSYQYNKLVFIYNVKERLEIMNNLN